MDMDDVLTGLKIAGALVAAAVAIVGVFGDYFHQDGRIKRSGILVIVAAFLTFAVATATSMFEARKAKKDSIEQAAKTEKILSEINRGLRPITKLSATYSIDFDSLAASESKYRARLDRTVRERLNRDKGFLQIEGGIPIGTPTHSIRFQKDSDLWPKFGEASPERILPTFTLTAVKMMRSPAKSDADKQWGGDFFAYDLAKADGVSLEWNFVEKRLSTIIKIDFNSDYWIETGKITSIQDLPGSQIFLSIPIYNHSFAEVKFNEVQISLGSGETLFSMAMTSKPQTSAKGLNG